jgi:hypothetical protein
MSFWRTRGFLVWCTALLSKSIGGRNQLVHDARFAARVAGTADQAFVKCYLHQLVYRAVRLFNRGLGHGVGCSVGSGDHNVANRLPCINPWAAFVLPPLLEQAGSSDAPIATPTPFRKSLLEIARSMPRRRFGFILLAESQCNAG